MVNYLLDDLLTHIISSKQISIIWRWAESRSYNTYSAPTIARFSLLMPKRVVETGDGFHTFQITDVFRNIVTFVDIGLLLCLNILC